MFEIEKISQQIKPFLTEVPENHKMAFITVANKEGVKGVFITKINQEWQIQTYGSYNIPDHNFDYGVEVQWSK
jgi:hypothetical protein